MDYNKIGQFIALRRKEIGLTQKDLADKVHVTDKAVSKWERGLGCPDVSLLGELSEILDVGIGEILNGQYDEKLKDNDKFILDAVNYSKENTEMNMYNKISKITYIALAFICLYLIFLSIFQFSNILAGQKFEYNENHAMLVQKKLDNIKEKTQKLEKMDLIYGESNIGEFARGIIPIIEETNLLNYERNEKVSYNNLTKIENEFVKLSMFRSSLVNIISFFDKENKNFYDLILNDTQYNSFSLEIAEDEHKNFYDLGLYDYKNIYNDEDRISIYWNYLNKYLDDYNKILDIALKVGEKNA